MDGGYTNRPNINWAAKSYPKKQTEWFNPNAFSSPTPAWAGGVNQGFGDARKDAVLGPGQTNFTTSFFKNFPIHENVSFKFRFETFNTWNHTEFQNVGNNFNVKAGVIQGNFGQITSTWDPRVLQLGGQLTF